MAFRQDGNLRAFPTDGNQSANQYRAMDLAAAGLRLHTAAGGRIYGVLIDDPRPGTYGSVQVRDVARVRVGAAFAQGVDLMVNAAGEFVPAVAAAGANAIVAHSVSAGVAGALASVELGYRGNI